MESSWDVYAAMRYEAQYGERDRKAEAQLEQLLQMRAGLFKLADLAFLCQPDLGKEWDDEKCERIDNIYREVTAPPIIERGLEF